MATRLARARGPFSHIHIIAVFETLPGDGRRDGRETVALAHSESEAIEILDCEIWAPSSVLRPIILIHSSDRVGLPGRRKELVTQLMAGGRKEGGGSIQHGSQTDAHRHHPRSSRSLCSLSLVSDRRPFSRVQVT